MLVSCFSGEKNTKDKPNFAVILVDDIGYGDIGSFGSTINKTPHLDCMATEGMKLTSFYVAAPVCTPSRAALMTGCCPKRNNMAAGVFLAGDSRGLDPDEITIAEVLKKKCYATGIMGKWYLGDQPEFLPTKQGFDEFFGLPYSHDIHPRHQNNKKHNFPDLPLLEGKEVIEINPDMNCLTQRITDREVDFIKKNKDKPFLYFPYPLPHRPVYASPEMMEQATGSIKSVRSGKWKLHANGELFNLEEDIGEKMNVANQNFEVVRRLEKYLEECNADLDNIDNCRASGKNTNPQYLVL
ncbi:sulfatase-like hydrolase/transferase [Flavicella sp.]|uniref:sulfatase-like hydrolase/transferase n=1 Tax=Flavicella sp. TaxID=2957742 RepID=UPI0030169325